MNLLEKAKGMLPKMPEDVFNIWIRPLIESNGWPFESIHSLHSNRNWFQYFGGNSIQTISNLVWHSQQIPLLGSRLHPNSQQIINWIILSYVHGRPTPVTKIKNGKGRESFLRSRQFIKSTGRLHTPLVLLEDSLGYHILDGNHRFAACVSLRPTPLFTVDAWIACRI
ncbi:hypothetical protein [Prosthecobacter sp.]|uniref:hypothetical protein n=1 Tax=Prosthecobacter sp. TaxID=1965333 RepID=UPI002AB98472|nr:hypothetical protein [Prosthecobacter sp.]MDZ4404228.1 hypothetical protein [Prosthecobacter sp.]